MSICRELFCCTMAMHDLTCVPSVPQLYVRCGAGISASVFSNAHPVVFHLGPKDISIPYLPQARTRRDPAGICQYPRDQAASKVSRQCLAVVNGPSAFSLSFLSFLPHHTPHHSFFQPPRTHGLTEVMGLSQSQKDLVGGSVGGVAQVLVGQVSRAGRRRIGVEGFDRARCCHASCSGPPCPPDLSQEYSWSSASLALFHQLSLQCQSCSVRAQLTTAAL